MNIEQVPRGDFNRINNILEKVGQYYTPPLREQILSIAEYSKKLAKYANTFLIVNDEKDIGILSVYCKNKTAFISTFGIDKNYNGKGYSKELLNYGLNYVERIGLFAVHLEVNKMNERAIAFYKKNRFHVIETREDSYIMELLLKTPKLSKNFDTQNRYIKVTRSSDSELKEHLYTIAKYFAKEFDYGPAYR